MSKLKGKTMKDSDVLEGKAMRDTVLDREHTIASIVNSANVFIIAAKLETLSDPELVAVKMCLDGLSTLIVKPK